MPWSNITSPVDPNLGTAASFFINGDLEGYTTTATKLGTLLTATHLDTDNQPHPLFKLAMWASSGVKFQLALGFYKTIRRNPPKVKTSSGNSFPTLRFWGVTMGFKDTSMAAADAYALIKDRCQRFYDNERDNDPTTGQPCSFGIIDQANRQLQPGTIYADAVAALLMADDNFVTTDLGNFPRYASFKHDIHLLQIDPA